PRNQGIALACDYEHGAADAPGNARQRQGGGVALRLGQRGAMAAHPEGFARQLRQAVPDLTPVEGTGKGNAGLYALVKRGGARRVVAAEAHAPDADTAGVEIAAARHVIDDGAGRHLVIAADRKLVLALALSWSVEHQDRNTAIEEGALVGFGLLLGRIEATDHDHHWRPLNARRLAQDAEQRLSLIGDFHPLAWRYKMRQRQLAALDGPRMRRLHLWRVVHEQEFCEVIIDAGPLQVLPSAQQLSQRQRLATHLLVLGRALRPGPAPFIPNGDR